MILVRYELPSDLPAIYRVNQLAFGRPDEAELVDLLRGRGKLLLSLVAVEGEQVLGHIAFTGVHLIPENPSLSGDVYPCGAGLGPLAVLPSHQRKGIGAELCVQGLERCRRLGLDFVILIGHPGYYPRFGFLPASHFGLACKWPVPDEAFMAIELRPAALQGVSGRAEYEPEFDDVT